MHPAPYTSPTFGVKRASSPWNQGKMDKKWASNFPIPTQRMLRSSAAPTCVPIKFRIVDLWIGRNLQEYHAEIEVNSPRPASGTIKTAVSSQPIPPVETTR